MADPLPYTIFVQNFFFSKKVWLEATSIRSRSGHRAKSRSWRSRRRPKSAWQTRCLIRFSCRTSSSRRRSGWRPHRSDRVAAIGRKVDPGGAGVARNPHGRPAALYDFRAELLLLEEGLAGGHIDRPERAAEVHARHHLSVRREAGGATRQYPGLG